MSCLKLKEMGFCILATCLTLEGADKIRPHVTAVVQCDVTKPADIIRLQEATESICSEKKLRVWALINNAGVSKCLSVVFLLI